jgi:general secretion pathway protein G
MRNRSRARRGFTLIEILLVLGIIVAMASVAIFVMWPQSKGAKIDICKAMLASVGDALEAYCANIGHYPTEEEGGMDALLTKPSYQDEKVGENWRGPYLKHEARDPWNNVLHYELTQAGSAEAQLTPYKLWSNGPDGMDGTEDDIKNWSETTLGK